MVAMVAPMHPYQVVDLSSLMLVVVVSRTPVGGVLSEMDSTHNESPLDPKKEILGHMTDESKDPF